MIPTFVYKPLYLIARSSPSLLLLSIAVVPFGNQNLTYPASSSSKSPTSTSASCSAWSHSISVYGIASPAGLRTTSTRCSARSLFRQMVSYELASASRSSASFCAPAPSISLRSLSLSPPRNVTWNLFGGGQFIAFFISHSGLRGDQPRPSIFRSGDRTHRRLSYRVQLHEVRHVLHG